MNEEFERGYPHQTNDNEAIAHKDKRKKYAVLSLTFAVLGIIVLWLSAIEYRIIYPFIKPPIPVFSTILLFAPSALTMLFGPPIAAIITGIFGMKSKQRGMAKTGLIIGIVVLVLQTLLFLLLVGLAKSYKVPVFPGL